MTVIIFVHGIACSVFMQSDGSRENATNIIANTKQK